jgi:2',3'-cyclic-nucleotide 2'-phosphodiesterase (5'-nucleotidase family)
LIIQWGRGNFTTTLDAGGYATTSVNFPITFPNSVSTITITGNDMSTGNQSAEGYFSYTGRSNSSFIVNYSQILGNSDNGETTAFDWIAIGN